MVDLQTAEEDGSGSSDGLVSARGPLSIKMLIFFQMPTGMATI